MTIQPTWVSDCGRVELYLGDCLEILPHVGTVDAVVTDPPYGIDGGRGGDSKKGKAKYLCTEWVDSPEYVEKTAITIAEWVVAEGIPAAFTPGNKMIWKYPEPAALGVFWTPANPNHSTWGFSTHIPILYYGKDYRAGIGALPNGRQLTSRSEKNGHPCPKPIEAWTWLVNKVAPQGAIVFDPFMGSGTTGVAAVRLGRRFIGIEIEPKYFEVAKKRIQVELAQGQLFEQPTAKAEQSALELGL